MAEIEFEEKGEWLSFGVRVIPRASKSEIVGEHDGAIKVRLASPPVNGAANAELIKFLAKKIKRSRSDVEVVSGVTSRTKRVRVRGASANDLKSLLSG